MKHIPIIILGIIFTFVFSCKRADEKLTTDANAKLSFSSDSILFDTILAGNGIKSITQRLIVTNHNKNAVKIGSIQLEGMANSNYKVIVNGIKSFYTTDLEIRGGDSIYILVELTIDPQNKDLPYVVTDTLTFNTNGNIQKVKLVAYGQDANFFKGDSTLGCNKVWDDIKPYVILKSVTVPANCTLTIKKGVRVFAHEDAVIKINGTLLVEGEKDSINLVHFQGDKFGEKFSNAPDQWQGIVFGSGSKGNKIKYAEIKNAITGIKMNPEADGDTIPELTISNSIIRNMTLYGVQAIGTDLQMENSLVANCAKNVVAGVGGGNYYFINCTFANYSYDFFREDPLFKLSKTYEGENLVIITGEIKSSIINTIIWGDQSEELQLDLTNSTDFVPSYSFIRTKKVFSTSLNNYLNVNPKFNNPRNYDFHPDSVTTFGKGLSYPGIFEDLNGKARDSGNTPGAYNK